MAEEKKGAENGDIYQHKTIETFICPLCSRNIKTPSGDETLSQVGQRQGLSCSADGTFFFTIPTYHLPLPNKDMFTVRSTFTILEYMTCTDYKTFVCYRTQCMGIRN